MSNITKYLLTLTFITLIACNAWADTHTAASCTKAAVLAAYNAASNGDIIVVPTGDCSSSNTWTSVLEIKKEVTIQGKGIDSTYIGLGFTGPAFEIEADNVRITGFTFDCRNQNTSNTGIIMAGSDNGACNASAAYTYGDFRIDHNKFVRCDEGSEGTTGYNAITSWQTVYGLIDNNTFENCTGECLSLQSDGVGGISRSNEPGQYADNVTIYVEDNIFNYSQSYQAENVVDGNSSSRFVFRYNTINLTGSATLHQVFSNHETCASSACDAGSKGDAGSALMEIYNNTINNTANDYNMFIIAWRAGRLYAYNNTITGHDSGTFIQAYSLRSGHRSGCEAQTVRGYGQYCHEVDGSLTVEGLSVSKTTLNGALGNNTGCPTMTSVTDFPTYGGSIIIGTEQIDYTAISTATLTPCTRGANGTTRAAHNNGVAVNLLKFGVCEGQPRQSYYWGNLYKATDGSAGVARNSVLAGSNENNPDYETYDIQSYTQRPQNWQYRNDGTAYSYTPYAYPHPLRGETDTDPPVLSSATISTNGTTLTLVFNEAVTNYTGFSISPSNTLTYSSGSGTATLVFTLTNTVYSGATDTISYTAGNVVDGASNPLATITDGSITNNSTQEASDTTAPAVTISTASGSTITSDSKTVAGTATDAVGVSGCKYRIGSDTIDATHGTACTGTTSWSCATSGYASGSNTVYVECYDAVPNYSTGHSITVTYNPPASTALLSGAVCKGCVVK